MSPVSCIKMPASLQSISNCIPDICTPEVDWIKLQPVERWNSKGHKGVQPIGFYHTLCLYNEMCSNNWSVWYSYYCIFKVLITTELSDLTHWGRDKMDANSQTIFSNAFSWMKMFQLRLKVHWSLFPKGPINTIPSLVKIMASHRSGEKPLSEPMLVSLPTHICVTRPQWVTKCSHTL